jgi:hypothetical protein
MALVDWRKIGEVGPFDIGRTVIEQKNGQQLRQSGQQLRQRYRRYGASTVTFRFRFQSIRSTADRAPSRELRWLLTRRRSILRSAKGCANS